MGKHVYARDASWSPSAHPFLLHWEHPELGGISACRRVALIMDNPHDPADTALDRCRAPGCRQRWDAFDQRRALATTEEPTDG